MNMHDEFFDEELLSTGLDFTDETVAKKVPKMERPESDMKKFDSSVGCDGGTSRVPSPTERAVDAKYAHVPRWTPDFRARLKNCVVGVGACALISGVLFWWQQAGLLDPRAAWPSFVVLALLTGLVIGRYALR